MALHDIIWFSIDQPIHLEQQQGHSKFAESTKMTMHEKESWGDLAQKTEGATWKAQNVRRKYQVSCAPSRSNRRRCKNIMAL